MKLADAGGVFTVIDKNIQRTDGWVCARRARFGCEIVYGHGETSRASRVDYRWFELMLV